MFNKKKEIVEPNLYDEVIDNKDGKSILATKIVKYAGVGLLVGAISLGSAFCITEAKTDHTREVCPLCVIGMELDINNDAGLNIGIEHQIEKMQEEYKEQGIDTEVYYEDNYVLLNEYEEYIMPTAIQLEDGTIIHTVPSGYVLKDGKGVKTTTIETEIGPTIIADLTEENEESEVQIYGLWQNNDLNLGLITSKDDDSKQTTYHAPNGWHIEEFGGIAYSVRDGYTLEYIDGKLTSVKIIWETKGR